MPNTALDQRNDEVHVGVASLVMCPVLAVVMVVC